jgi:hypothetical protein
MADLNNISLSPFKAQMMVKVSKFILANWIESWNWNRWFHLLHKEPRLSPKEVSITWKVGIRGETVFDLFNHIFLGYLANQQSSGKKEWE